MRDRRGLRTVVVAGLLACLGLAAGAQEEPTPDEPAQADSPARPSAGIEEIVVTAERREAGIQETPVAVSAFSGEDLDEAGLQDFEDLGFNIPNFQFGRSLIDSGGITIRGVSSSAGDRATAFHIDGIYQNEQLAAEGVTFFDVQRVEVLRGPQGTLYGRNAVGGSINVVSNPPTGELEAMGDVQLGTYDQVQTRGVLNVPLLGEKLATRLSVYHEDRDGFQNNQASDRDKDDADDARNLALRGQVLMAPSDDLEVTLRSVYSTAGGVGPGRKVLHPFPTQTIISPMLPIPLDLYAEASPNPKDVRHIFLDFIGDVDVEQWNVNGMIDWDLYEVPGLGDLNVKLLGSFLDRDTTALTDQDLSDIPLAHTSTSTESQEAVAELQIASVGNPDLDWIVGLFFLDAQASSSSTTLAQPLVALGVNDIIPIVINSSEDARSVAVFSQGTIRPWTDWAFTAGLRFTHDEKQATAAREVVIIPSTMAVLFNATDEAGRGEFDSVTGMLRAEWSWSPDNSLYLTGSRGYKAGQVNTAVNEVTGKPIDPTVAKQEYIWAIELGSKNRFFEDRLQANLASFYYYEQNLQFSELINISQFTQNAGSAHFWGLEGEFVALPWPELRLGATASYLGARYNDFLCKVNEDIDIVTGNPRVLDCSGNTPPRSPSYTFSLSGQYDLDLGRFGLLTPQIRFYASDSLNFRPFGFETDEQDAYTKTDVRLTWRSRDERLTVEGFVENVFDEDVIQTQITGTLSIGSPRQSLLDEPRTAGVQIGFRF